MRFFITIFFLTFFPLLAQENDQQQSVYKTKIENYFNSMKTFKSFFSQIDDGGDIQQGALYIQKPGKMRVEYKNDQMPLIVSDGTWIVNYDKELKQSSHIPLSSSPAELMIKSAFSFDDGLEIQKMEITTSVVKVTMKKTNAVEAGTITFIFSQNPFELKEWVAIDGQGKMIRVSLRDITKNPDLSSSLFIPPQGADFSKPDKG